LNLRNCLIFLILNNSSLIIWAISGSIATLCALCYIELGLLIESTGAEYSYCNDAYGSLIGFLVGWTQLIMCKPAALAVMVTAFANYVSAPFYPGCDAPELLKKFLSICAIMFIMIVNGLSVKASERMQILFTVVKLLLISAIIVGGLVQIANGETENFENAFEGTNPSVSAWETGILHCI
jgi:L-type amino acid transporter 9